MLADQRATSTQSVQTLRVATVVRVWRQTPTSGSPQYQSSPRHGPGSHSAAQSHGVYAHAYRARSRARDRSGLGSCSTRICYLPNLRRTQSADYQIPWLYVKGISTRDFSDALPALLRRGSMERIRLAVGVEFDRFLAEYGALLDERRRLFL